MFIGRLKLKMLLLICDMLVLSSLLKFLIYSLFSLIKLKINLTFCLLNATYRYYKIYYLL